MHVRNNYKLFFMYINNIYIHKLSLITNTKQSIIFNLFYTTHYLFQVGSKNTCSYALANFLRKK